MVAIAARPPAVARTGLRARVGIVTADFYPSYGGQGRHTHDLWRHLREAGVDVRVLSPGRNELPGHSRGGGLAARLGKGVGFSLYASAAMRRWQAGNDIDLLHLNGGPGGVLLATKPPVPTVYTAHHTYAQQARNVPGQSWKRLLAALEARSYGHADLVTTDSPSTADSVRDELGVDPAKVAVIPSGFDPETFRPIQVHGIDQSVLYVGRLDARKGFQFLIEAWAAAVAMRRGPRLFVVGSGPLRRWAEAYLEARGLLDSVAFLGRVPEQELVAWYNRVDALAVPSRFEGFGLSALEAIACGTPVVATDVEGLRDVVVDGIDGTLVSFGDVDGYARALVAAVERRGRISAERLAQVTEQYRWPRIAGLYLDAYGRALAA